MRAWLALLEPPPPPARVVGVAVLLYSEGGPSTRAVSLRRNLYFSEILTVAKLAAHVRRLSDLRRPRRQRVLAEPVGRGWCHSSPQGSH